MTEIEDLLERHGPDILDALDCHAMAQLLATSEFYKIAKETAGEVGAAIVVARQRPRGPRGNMVEVVRKLNGMSTAARLEFFRSGEIP